MRISQKMLRNILPDHFLASANLPNAFKLAKTVGRYYCTPMTIAGKCPAVCDMCRARLEGVVEKMASNRNSLRSPVGVLIWNLRTLVNNSVETPPQVITTKKNLFGIPEEPKSIWDAYAETI